MAYFDTFDLKIGLSINLDHNGGQAKYIPSL